MTVSYLKGFLANFSCLILLAELRGQCIMFPRHYADLHLVDLGTRISTGAYNEGLSGQLTP
jgi:hypothetical protein